ncbi:MAG: ATP-binding protein, partial [Myxococcota bacterium]
RIVYVNPGFTRITGFSAADAIGRTPRILQGPRTDRSVLDRLKRRLSAGDDFEGTTVNYRKNGTEFVMRWYVRPLVNDAGAVTHYVGVQKDVTADDHARREAKRLHAAVESMEDAVLIIGHDRCARYANPALLALVGRTAAEVTGRFVERLSFLDVSADRPNLIEVLGRLRERGEKSWRGLVPLRGAGQQRLSLDATVTSVELGGETSYVLAGRDVTKERRVEAIASALNMTENTGYIFSGIRHELGNPVNSLKTALIVLRDNLERYPPEKVRSYCDRMVEEIGRMEYLLSALRSVPTSTQPLSLAPVESQTFFSKFENLIRRDVATSGAKLEMAGDAAPLWFLANERALHQVLINLVTNAIDAVRTTPAAIIGLRWSGREDEVEIAVSDNGVGLTDEQQQRLFQPFNTTKRKGTGLGLVISRRLMAQMNGTIAVASARGRGTTVTLSLERA